MAGGRLTLSGDNHACVDHCRLEWIRSIEQFKKIVSKKQIPHILLSLNGPEGIRCDIRKYSAFREKFKASECKVTVEIVSEAILLKPQLFFNLIRALGGDVWGIPNHDVEPPLARGIREEIPGIKKTNWFILEDIFVAPP